MILMNDSSRMMTEHLVEMSHYCNGDRTRDLNYDRTSGRNVPWLHSWPDPWPNLWPDPWADPRPDPRPDPCPDPWPMSRRAVEMSRDWTHDHADPGPDVWCMTGPMSKPMTRHSVRAPTYCKNIPSSATRPATGPVTHAQRVKEGRGRPAEVV